MILDGKKIKDILLKEIKLKLQDLNLSLAVIQVGNNPASDVYISQKQKMCEELNIEFKHYKFSDKASENEISQKIEKLNMNNTTGILLQLPLKKRFNQKKLQNMINPLKDVDGLSAQNMGNLIKSERTLMPCTAKGILEILKCYNIKIAGQKVVVVGRSELVGKPIAMLLLNEDATVTVCHSNTADLKAETILADILIVAVGKKHLITSDMVKDGVVVIDVGINREDKNLYGDADFENLKGKVSYITPVPGGIGPMTIAMLAQNIYEAYLLQRNNHEEI